MLHERPAPVGQVICRRDLDFQLLVGGGLLEFLHVGAQLIDPLAVFLGRLVDVSADEPCQGQAVSLDRRNRQVGQVQLSPLLRDSLQLHGLFHGNGATFRVEP
ncbi:hypothetical protein D3C84_955150 [compost metagenome]